MEYDVCLICSNNLRLLSHSIKSIAMLSVSGPHAPKKTLHRVKLSKLSTLEFEDGIPVFYYVTL